MPWDKEKIIDLLLRAGEIAASSKKRLRREFKADSSIVTQADWEIEELITGELEAVERGTYIIGEETVSQKGEEYIRCALREEAFVIDPIDGTAPYAYGMPNWGISVGRMEGGALADGAIYLPDFGELVANDGDAVLEGALEDGAWKWRELSPPETDTTGAGLVGITQELAKWGKVRLRNPVQVLGAAVVPLAGLLQGRFAGYLGSVKLWDVAGALPLLLRHGFSITVRKGKEIRRVGAEVSDDAYHLQPQDRRRWKFRSDLLICRAEDEERLRKAFAGD